MSKKILIDAVHSEETRIALISDGKLEELDLETKRKKQLKRNIYLARITRVEPSLQAAFVEFEDNRQGFLPYSEIHTDYFQIPVEDQEEVRKEQAKLEEKFKKYNEENESKNDEISDIDDLEQKKENDDENDRLANEDSNKNEGILDLEQENEVLESADDQNNDEKNNDLRDEDEQENKENSSTDEEKKLNSDELDKKKYKNKRRNKRNKSFSLRRKQYRKEEKYSSLAYNLRKRYKIQEVIKKHQILLVQVVKEERGNKGAALTTYLSIAGRYCVLMPNKSNKNGISRKINNAKDRSRLKKVIQELNPENKLSLIIRTAGAERKKAEINKDFKYVSKIWENIRKKTLKSSAPSLIYEEADIIKRTIRDLYTKEIEGIIVAGNKSFKQSKLHMKELMPSHVKKIEEYNPEKNKNQSLFQLYKIEQQLMEIHSPNVMLPSGGSIVINQTEALVAIDVNSGKSIKSRNIEDTALLTNLEAAEEISKQVKLRDMGGLIVIDFIDMSKTKSKIKVEKKLKEFLQKDRSKISLERISSFGLLEMSRQRLKPSLIESTSKTCQNCGGTGIINSNEFSSMLVLRAIEEAALKKKPKTILVKTLGSILSYIINHKRGSLSEIEERFNTKITITIDDSLLNINYDIKTIMK